MANIHINRGGTALGVFPEEEVREGLKTARFIPTDLGWREGMATWLPLAQFPELGAAPPAPAAPAPSIPSPDAPAVERAGLPWDRRQQLGFLKAFTDTLQLVLMKPTEAFSLMKTEGGLGEPIIYGLIGGSAGFIVYFLFSVFLSSFGILSDRNALAGMMGLGFGTVLIVILMPLFLGAGLFIGAGILHLCLMLVGGATRSFEATFRVVCFSVGSAYTLMIIPFCGGGIAGIWCMVLECIGLARVHNTSTGKAVLAVFLPLIVCCGGGFLVAMMFGVLGSLAGSH
jgi:hypothetical protein